MCYRVSTDKIGKLETQFKMVVDDAEAYKQFHHVSGFDKPMLPVITSESKDIQLFQWKTHEQYNSLNAKSETLFTTAFKTSVNRRCLILVKGFFEHRDCNKVKYPYYIRAKGGDSFALGGIISKDNRLSIITTPANEFMAPIHNVALRMPFIVPVERYQEWIDPDLTKEEIQNLMQPYAGEMEAHTVSKDITKRGIDTNLEDFTLPVVYKELEFPQSLF